MPEKEAKSAAKATKPAAKATKPAAKATKPAAKATKATAKIAKAPKPAAGRGRSKSTPSPGADEIAERAYQIYETEGGGDHTEHWLRAERELTGG